MNTFQIWLVTLLQQDNPVQTFMRTAWGWPMMESLHFISLSMLVGPIAIFDLRLLGVARRIPMAAARKLVPIGLTGFAVSLLTGITFLMTEPNQYIYNSSFLLKALFMLIAGANAGIFALSRFGRELPDNGGATPTYAKVIAVVSLTLWVGVIVSGRLITFYRPAVCPKGADLPAILLCIPSNR